MGLMQTEIVNITAEAYDVAMDISFPRGVYQQPVGYFLSSIIILCLHACAVGFLSSILSHNVL